MNSLRAIPALVVSALLLCQAAFSQTATADELSEARRWAASKFEGQAQAQEDHGYLLPHLKSGVLEKNSRRGHKLRIADKLFAAGINCPSVGTVNVHLPIPARRFTAWIGVDSNDVTYYSGGGRGNVVVAVNANDKEGFRSPTLHEGLPAIFVDITWGKHKISFCKCPRKNPAQNGTRSISRKPRSLWRMGKKWGWKNSQLHPYVQFTRLIHHFRLSMGA